MKKTYSTPTAKLFVVRGNKNIMLTTSLAVGTTGVNGSAALGREDNSWDIWGNGDDDFED